MANGRCVVYVGSVVCVGGMVCVCRWYAGGMFTSKVIHLAFQFPVLQRVYSKPYLVDKSPPTKIQFWPTEAQKIQNTGGQSNKQNRKQYVGKRGHFVQFSIFGGF